MSTGSWDESSNLVRDLPSPPNSADDVHKKSQAEGISAAAEVFKDKSGSSPARGKHGSPHKHGIFSKNSKAAKGLGFLIKVSKEGGKRRSKSPSKSRSKSPSKENLAEYSDLPPVDDQVKAKSEQWQAFLQMQDRIKQNVLKTQESIGKLSAGRISPSGRISPARHDPLEADDGGDNSAPTPWSNLGAEDAPTVDESAPWVESEWTLGDDSSEIRQSTSNPFSANIDQEDDGHLSGLPTENRDWFDVSVTSAVPVAGNPFANPDLFSMEEDNQIDLLGVVKPVPPSTPVDPSGDEMDLLGFGLEPNSVKSRSQPAPLVNNDDLLSLDDFLSGGAPQFEPTNVEPTDWFMGCASALSSNQSSLCSSPVAFDSEFLAEQGQFAMDSTAVSELARTLVDDFLQWGAEAEKESSSTEPLAGNPFGEDSDRAVSSRGDDSFNPFDSMVGSAGSVAGFLHSLPSQPQATQSSAAFDPFTTLSTADGVSKDSPSQLDPFGCSVPTPSELTSMDLNANPREQDNSSMSELGVDITDSTPIHQSLNPFSSKVSVEHTSEHFSAFDDDFFSSKGFGQVDQDADSIWGTSEKSVPTQQDADSIWGTSEKSVPPQQDADNIWGTIEQFVPAQQDADSIWGTGGAGSPTQAFNPFEDDLFTASNLPTITADDGGGERSGSVHPVNPFLTASFENLTIGPVQSDNVHKLFVSSTDELDTIGTQPSELQDQSQPADPFDPFSHSASEAARPDSLTQTEVQTKDEVDMSAFDKEDEDQNDDDESMGFKLQIRAEPVNNAITGAAPVPFLPPPPKRPKSPPVSSRENPFDKESPPEEDFASFQVVEEKKEEAVQPRGVLKSMSSESSGYDDDESQEPLEPFRPTLTKSCWKLMLRQPVKKKLAGNRYWKTVYVKIVMVKDGPVLKVYESEDCEGDVMQELPLQPCYSLSELTVQQFDQYGKIHTVKMQYIFYRERVGIKPERIAPSIVKKPKANMVLDHAPQVSELLKFGSLDKEEIRSFVWEMEDAFMRMEVRREKTLTYTKDEMQVEVWDEYVAVIDRDGHTLNQKARVRMFVLAFITGMPWCELGINDRTRKGKEVVGRHDIIPVKTEDWIRIEDAEFHCVVDRDMYEKTNNIRFHPLDACQFELLRFRVRPRENRELPLQLRAQQIMKDRHYEIRCDMLVTGYHAFSKKCGQFPCEDIEIRFKIPESWIYYFRYERKFRYGSLKAVTRKPGKIKGLERITMMAQGLLSSALMEASVGTAKYEHLHRSVVWRVARLPERNQGAYKNHLFVLRLDLGPHDEIPDSFEEWATVEFTTPASTVSKAQVRSISVENPDPPEKWVRYVAKYQYRVQMDNKVETSSDHEMEDD